MWITGNHSFSHSIDGSLSLSSTSTGTGMSCASVNTYSNHAFDRKSCQWNALIQATISELCRGDMLQQREIKLYTVNTKWPHLLDYIESILFNILTKYLWCHLHPHVLEQFYLIKNIWLDSKLFLCSSWKIWHEDCSYFFPFARTPVKSFRHYFFLK